VYATVRAPRFYKKKSNPAPFIIVAVLVLLLGCWIFNLTCKKEKPVSTTEYVNYISTITPYIEKSNELSTQRRTINGDLAALMSNREQMDAELKSLVDSCQEVRDGLYAVQPPQLLSLPDSALKICSERRYRAMEKYRSDIINVLFNTIDTSIYVNNIADEMTELLYSDGDYLFFKQKAGDLLQGKGVNEALPDSRWTTNLQEASTQSIEALIQSLRGTEVHGVALGKVTLDPTGRLEVQNNENVFRLPATDSLTVTVVVENQGNRDESRVSVTVTYYSATDSTPRHDTKEVDIGAGGQAEVTFTGLTPTPGGVRNVLEIMAGPVPREANTDNNKKIIYFVTG
jgi:CARDB